MSKPARTAANESVSTRGAPTLRCLRRRECRNRCCLLAAEREEKSPFVWQGGGGGGARTRVVCKRAAPPLHCFLFREAAVALVPFSSSLRVSLLLRRAFVCGRASTCLCIGRPCERHDRHARIHGIRGEKKAHNAVNATRPSR